MVLQKLKKKIKRISRGIGKYCLYRDYLHESKRNRTLTLRKFVQNHADLDYHGVWERNDKILRYLEFGSGLAYKTEWGRKRLEEPFASDVEKVYFVVFGSEMKRDIPMTEHLGVPFPDIDTLEKDIDDALRQRIGYSYDIKRFSKYDLLAFQFGADIALWITETLMCPHRNVKEHQWWSVES